MRKTKIKTIDLKFLGWFDKVNGNSYFAGEIIVNYGLEDVRRYKVPFQYGYGSFYEYASFERLAKEENLKVNENATCLHYYCRENNIILRSEIIRGCKKRDLMQFNK